MRLHVVKRTCDIIRLGVDIVIRRVSYSFSECHFAVTTFRVIYFIEFFVLYYVNCRVASRRTIKCDDCAVSAAVPLLLVHIRETNSE